MRRVIVVVFPDPAPARMHTGPRTLSTARSCCGLRSAKMAESAGALVVFDFDSLDEDVVSRTIGFVSVDGCYRLDYIQSFGHFPEDRVLIVEPGRGTDGYEELRPVRVRSGIGHGQQAGAVELRPSRGALLFEPISRTASAGPLGVSSLDHEARYHPVKQRAVIERLRLPLPVARVPPLPLARRQVREVGDGGGSMIGHE